MRPPVLRLSRPIDLFIPNEDIKLRSLNIVYGSVQLNTHWSPWPHEIKDNKQTDGKEGSKYPAIYRLATDRTIERDPEINQQR